MSRDDRNTQLPEQLPEGRFEQFPGDFLDAAGLNRQHVFALDQLPDEVRDSLGDRTGFTQLILIGHAGRRLWQAVQAAGLPGHHPIDDFTRQTIAHCFAERLPGHSYRLLYPDHERLVGLQAFGELAGWHHPSPFMVGIDAEWGSWFAYRALLLADTRFHATPRRLQPGPCAACVAHPCLDACPADALRPDFQLDRCLAHRREEGSSCENTCLARLACPVGAEHRYTPAQMRHSYAVSLAMIRLHEGAKPV